MRPLSRLDRAVAASRAARRLPPAGALALAAALALAFGSAGLGPSVSPHAHRAPLATAFAAKASLWCAPKAFTQAPRSALGAMGDCIAPLPRLGLPPLAAASLGIRPTPSASAFLREKPMGNPLGDPLSMPLGEAASLAPAAATPGREIDFLGGEIDRLSPEPSAVPALLAERPTYSPVKRAPWPTRAKAVASPGALAAPSSDGFVRAFVKDLTTKAVVTTTYEATTIDADHPRAVPPELQANAKRMSFYLGELTRKLRGAYPGRWPERAPILYLTSGYRSVEHNARVNGVPGSSHTHALAADIGVVGMSTVELAEFIRANMDDLEAFDQLLAEQASASISWVHVQLGHTPRAARRQVFSVDTSCSKAKGPDPCQQIFHPGVKRLFG